MTSSANRLRPPFRTHLPDQAAQGAHCYPIHVICPADGGERP